MTTMPFRKKLLHVFPHEDLADGTDYYLSRSRLPGMLPLDELDLQLYGYPINPTEMQSHVFLASNGRADTVKVGIGTGGCIQEWTPGAGPQFLNHAGWCGRSINQTLFVSGGGVHMNPTMAGDKYDAFFPDHPDPKVPAPPINYRQHTLMHGSRLLSLEHDGNNLKTESVPLEWDGDGVWFQVNNGGNSMDAVEYPDLRFRFDIDAHWQLPGLHRFRSRVIFPEVSEVHNLFWTPMGMHLRMGFDEITVFNGETNTFTDALNKPLCEAFDSTVTWQPQGTFFMGTLAKAHGRAAETRQNTTLQGGRVLSLVYMDGPTSKRVRTDNNIPPAPPNGPISSPRAVVAEVTDIQTRYGFEDRLAIGGGTGLFMGSDQTGSYPHNLFGNTGNGLIYSTSPTSTNPWSFKQDTAVGLYVPDLDVRSGSPETESQSHLRWATKRSTNIPTNGVIDQPTMILANTRQWTAGLPRPSGVVESTCYLCTGTVAEVRAMMEFLAQEVE